MGKFNKLYFQLISMPRQTKDKINIETVKHVARLARLELSEKEISKFQKELNDVLSAFKELDKALGSTPSFQPLPIKDVFREDVVEPPISQTTALANTKHKEKGFFKGPRAV